MTEMLRLSYWLAGTAALAIVAATPSFASSHREAPGITETPKLDGSDFYLFRSYEPGRSAYVTAIADYLPLQDPFGGPNYFTLDPNAYYDINIDNEGDAQPHITFRFHFKTVNRNFALSIGGKSVTIPLVEGVGQTSAANPMGNLNVVETYTVTMLRTVGGKTTATALKDAATGSTVFTKPIDNIGNKSIPDYASYANSYIYTVNIPGCGTGKLFSGQRKDPFVVNLGETFDLVNYAHPAGEAFAASAFDSLANKNVTSLAIEAPIACLTGTAGPVIGGWTTSSKFLGTPDSTGNVALQQKSRLGNPLVNELLIGLDDKDAWNASTPLQEPHFYQYYTNPTVPAVIEALFSSAGVKAPTQFPRKDLVAVFLTGVPGLNQPAHVRPAEEMRLNTGIAPVAKGAQNRLGVIAGDAAGFPNGRRPGDDVVDIELRVLVGKLYVLGLFGGPSNAPGYADLTDGAFIDDSHFDGIFPYVRTPLAGSPQAGSGT